MDVAELLKSLEEAVENKEKEKVGPLLVELQSVMGITRKRLSEHMGIGPDYLGKIIAKVNLPSRSSIENLQRALLAEDRNLPKRYLRILIDLQEENPRVLAKASFLLKEYELRQGRELSNATLLAMLEMDGIR